MALKTGKTVVLWFVLVLVMSSCSSLEATPVKPPSIFSDESELKSRSECLKGKGWDVTLEDSSIAVTVPSEQRELYMADREKCLEESGANLNKQLSPEEYEVVYKWYSDISSCLNQHNWPISEKPSFNNFQSTYNSDPWIPWELVSGEDYEQMFLDCPMADPTGSYENND